jgi:hypothetical protein
MQQRTLALTLLLAASASSFVPTTRRFRGLHACGKKDADDDEVPEVRLETVGSVVEFDDGKHSDRALLGVIKEASSKAKGGTIYHVEDSDEKIFSIHGKSIHAVFSPPGDKEKDVSKILSSFVEVSKKAPTELGVEPEVLEMAWELCSETEKDSFSTKSILGVIDESLVKGSIGQYKAFRLLTSDLGKIFFKTLNGGRFKAKATKAVSASKEQWCKGPGGDDEWCFV